MGLWPVKEKKEGRKERLRGEIKQKREDQHSTLTVRDKAEERNNGG
jgi:hypothetical protein